MAERRALIRFYAAMKQRVVDPPWPGGTVPSDWLLSGAPMTYFPEQGEVLAGSFPGLANLKYGRKGTAYVRQGTGEDADVTFGQVLETNDLTLHLRMWRMRLSQLPSIHDLLNGKTTLIDLTKTQGIAEAVDYVFFLESCVVGVLLNRPAPSKQDVVDYISQMTGVNLKLPVLTREDALDLVRGNLVIDVDVEVVAGHFEALAAVDEEIGTAAGNVNTPGLRTIRLSMGSEKEKRREFWRWWEPKARELVRRRDAVKRLAVTQATDGAMHSETVNLLEQRIGLEVDVPISSGRTVDEDAARKAILDAYDRNVQLIGAAADRLDARAENRRAERKKPGPRPPRGTTV